MIKSLYEVFKNFDWNSFWMNSIVSLIFLILSILLSSYLIPRITIKLLKKRRKKYYSTSISYIIQEICIFLEDTSFKNADVFNETLNIYSKDSNFLKFIAISKVNIFNTLVDPTLNLHILNKFEGLSADDNLELVKYEKEKIVNLKSKLENIINNNSLELYEELDLEIRDLCIKISSFEIQFNHNFKVDDLISAGIMNREAVFGNIEIKDIYSKILKILKQLLELNIIEYKVEKVSKPSANNSLAK